jgi:hypothetical protein
VAVWLVLAILLAAIVVIEHTDRRRERSAGAGAADARALLPVPVDELGAVEIADAGRLHRFEREAAGTWFYHGAHTQAAAPHQHQADPVLAKRIESVLAAFGRTRIERRFRVDSNGSAYGVATPEILVLLYRPKESQPLVQYAVGHVAPDTVSRYVLVVGSPDVLTIPGYQVDNLLTLVRAVGGSSGPALSSPPGGEPIARSTAR